MLEKNTSTTHKYTISHSMGVTVKNVRVEPDRGDAYYKTVFTLKIISTNDHPISFDSIDEIDDFVKNLEIEDPQTSLLGES